MPKFRRKLVRHNNGENNTSNSNLIDNNNNNNNNNNGSDIDFNFVNNSMNDNKGNTFKQEQNLLTTACRTKYVTFVAIVTKLLSIKTRKIVRMPSNDDFNL